MKYTRAKTFETAKGFERAVERYFCGICRTVVLTEDVPSGLRDEKDKELLTPCPLLNDNGEPVTDTRWFRPPSMTDLCLYLGISEARLAEAEARDESYARVAARARARIESYLQTQLELSKRMSGIAFKLTHLYGWKNQPPPGAGARTLGGGESLPLAEKFKLLAALECEEENE